MVRQDVIRTIQLGQNGDLQNMMEFLQKYILYRKKELWTPKRVDPMQILEAHQYAVEWSMREFNINVLKNKQGQVLMFF